MQIYWRENFWWRTNSKQGENLKNYEMEPEGNSSEIKKDIAYTQQEKTHLSGTT
jgi:hypothetical protein